MIRRVTLPLLLLVTGSALAGDDLAAIFDRFDHAEHAAVFRRHDVGCPTCHAVGRAEGTSLLPDRSVCHTCHAPGQGDLGVGDGLRAAPDRCGTCHPTVAPPATHVAGWIAGHGVEARYDGDSCRTCHDRGSCVDCHDRKMNGGFEVHDPSWLRTHGIAVRAAPASCDACHAQAECTACHGSSAGFGRSR
ncbi:MAG: hypothetical protein H6738_17530 [Alphaproteobacteria bacterium]|nr:hypothetical protein [Alphaproteobacteria bacterium]MCB9698586.1 hypothetical protein [Alphaproteobacteria bacterium]